MGKGIHVGGHGTAIMPSSLLIRTIETSQA
jgi:hypothetical protein